MKGIIVECIPNFSEGRVPEVIEGIEKSVAAVRSVRLLNVDVGYDANRTVFTFAGEPDAVAEAAFQAAKRASETIDMSRHEGTHPRLGAMDVCPFVPVAGITMREVVDLARMVAKRIGDELSIPVYCYEEAAFTAERRLLANCRSGQYEGLAEKLSTPGWKPDYGPDTMNVKSGASIVGARKYLVAYNVNLDTKSVDKASMIAGVVRESGRKVKTDDGVKVIPGLLKSVRAIGWYVEEYGKAQVSMNLTDIDQTTVHEAFETVKRVADEMGVKVTGSELIGLIPLKAMVEAGRFYSQGRKSDDNSYLVDLAISHLGLNEVKPFIPQSRILDYMIQ